jgi:hypothetical protein
MRVAANLAINFEIVQHETVTVLGKPTMKIKDS